MKKTKIVSLCISIIIALSFVTLTGCGENNSNTVKSENNNMSESKISLTLGEYYPQIDESILGNIDGIMGDELIDFVDNNNFNLYTGFGNGVSGTYTISNNIITCTADKFYSVYGPIQEINASLSLKINSNSEIEIIDNSESFEIKLVDIQTNTLTDTPKDMSLWPFIKGIKLTSSK